MTIVQNTGVVEQCAKVTSRNVFLAGISSVLLFFFGHATHHSKIDTLVILESVEQAYEPLALSSGQDVALCQDVADLVQLEQQLLAHDLQGADFTCVLLLGQVHLSITTLADLREDLEVALPQPSASLAEVGTLAAQVLCEGIVVFFFGSFGRRRVLGLELGETVLAGMDVGKEVVVVVEEVCISGQSCRSVSGQKPYTAA